jgi:hypothetical protein
MADTADVPLCDPGADVQEPIERIAEMGYKVIQIEVSSLCSLECVYCPHPSQLRPKGNMSMDVFKKCIELIEHSDNPVYRGRKFVWLNRFGEPLLNPLWPQFIALATSRQVEVSFASNGIAHAKKLFPRELWETLARAGLRGVVLSAHAKSESKLREHIGDVVRVIGIWEPKPGAFYNWAGQVKLKKTMASHGLAIPVVPCDYQANNMFAVTWNGMLAACCYDIEGRVSVSVDDVLRCGFSFQSISLCSRCRLGRGDANWLSDPLHQILD